MLVSGLHFRIPMAIREFTDSKGVAWRVWCTTPDEGSPLAPYYPGGWLTFDCGSETLRRLSPPPANWETAPDDRLQLMCRVAEEVPRHTGEMRKLARPADLEADPSTPGRQTPPNPFDPESRPGA